MTNFTNQAAQENYDRIQTKIEKLEAQVVKTQDEQFGTHEGSQKILALYKTLGKLEDELKHIKANFYQVVKL